MRESGAKVGRVWTWLLLTFLTFLGPFAILALEYSRGREDYWQPLIIIFLAGAFVLSQVSRSGREVLRALPMATSHDFLYLFVPHSIACSAGILTSAVAIFLILEERADPDPRPDPNSSSFGVLIFFGFLLIALVATLWSLKRQEKLGLRDLDSWPFSGDDSSEHREP